MRNRKRIARLEPMVATLQVFAIKATGATRAVYEALRKEVDERRAANEALETRVDRLVKRVCTLEALHAEPEPAKVSGRAVSFSERPGQSCCDMRRKVVAAVVAVLPEESCGLNESVLADFVTFNEEASEKPILRFAFCPWCGTPRGPDSEERVTPPPFGEDQS